MSLEQQFQDWKLEVLTEIEERLDYLQSQRAHASQLYAENLRAWGRRDPFLWEDKRQLEFRILKIQGVKFALHNEKMEDYMAVIDSKPVLSRARPHMKPAYLGLSLPSPTDYITARL